MGILYEALGVGSIPPLIIVGSILGIIAAIFLLILRSLKIKEIVRSSAVRLYKWLRSRPVAFNEWRWWREYRPSWELVKWGDMRITFTGKRYHIELPVGIKLNSGNDRYESICLWSHVWIDVYHKGKGWEKKPYGLYSNQLSHDVIHGQWQLAPLGYLEQQYIFAIDTSAKPLIGNTTSCKLMGEIKGRIGTPRVVLDGVLKKKTNRKFSVNVVWGEGE